MNIKYIPWAGAFYYIFRSIKNRRALAGDEHISERIHDNFEIIEAGMVTITFNISLIVLVRTIRFLYG